MPKHKINREDEIPPANWKKLLAYSEKLDYSQTKQTPPIQTWLTCVLAIDWLMGKRINEILQLKRKDISFTDKEIRIKFKVGKKHETGTLAS